MNIFEIIDEFQLELVTDENGKVRGVSSGVPDYCEVGNNMQLILDNLAEIERVLIARKNGEPLLRILK